MEQICTKKIRVYGIVQGVGFRPTVSRLAAETGIAGTVINRGSYVEIRAQGREEQIRSFLHELKERPPKRSAILKIDVKDSENAEPLLDSFEIAESKKEKGEIFISPDIATCPDCRRELYDPSDRRYLHPFINCTSCGPRLTILDALPYDRKRTSMKEFPMCPDCEREYYDPASRRYDAQPVCCNDCGPELYLAGRGERGREALAFARQILHDGGVVAVKGIGGFHLCCDASSQEAVMRLRRMKRRPAKPFAVMMKDENVVRRECLLNEEQLSILTGHQKPIQLLERKGGEGARLCDAVAPGNPKVGVMLPYAPVQMLLFDNRDELSVSDMLVMTSGNISGAPICRDDEEALREIAGFCDCILSHNRRIRVRCDDSVMDFAAGAPYMIRRSRGYAPLPVLLSSPMEGCVLAMGGELKNTFCIGKGSLFYPSSYIGDLADLRSVRALKETIGKMETLLELKPAVIACDLHPAYHSTELAQELAREMEKDEGRAVRIIPIQHHYAHIVSCMAENDYSGPVLGASFDGTGYGTDGSIWGGEILLADYEGFERLGSIRPFQHAGGDAASREGWRIAVSMLHSLLKAGDISTDLDFNSLIKELDLCELQAAKPICVMVDRGINCVPSTSAGRLFDAVSAVLGICRESTYEGEASCRLQFAAEAFRKRMAAEAFGKSMTAEAFGKSMASEVSGKGMVSEVSGKGMVSEAFGKSRAAEAISPRMPEKRAEDGRLLLSTDRLFAEIVLGKLRGEDPGYLAYRFHEELAAQIAGALLHESERTGVRTMALSGGVYQNTLLLELTRGHLEKAGCRVLIHQLIPPNDGGICLGQAVAAMARIHNAEK